MFRGEGDLDGERNILIRLPRADGGEMDLARVRRGEGLLDREQKLCTVLSQLLSEDTDLRRRGECDGDLDREYDAQLRGVKDRRLQRGEGDLDPE